MIAAYYYLDLTPEDIVAFFLASDDPERLTGRVMASAYLRAKQAVDQLQEEGFIYPSRDPVFARYPQGATVQLFVDKAAEEYPKNVCLVVDKHGYAAHLSNHWGLVFDAVALIRDHQAVLRTPAGPAYDGILERCVLQVEPRRDDEDLTPEEQAACARYSAYVNAMLAGQAVAEKVEPFEINTKFYDLYRAVFKEGNLDYPGVAQVAQLFKQELNSYFGRRLLKGEAAIEKLTSGKWRGQYNLLLTKPLPVALAIKKFYGGQHFPV